MVRKCYPYGKKKAFNVTYDDGVLQDVRFVALLNRYGLKGTFNLNSALMENEFEWIHETGCVVKRLKTDVAKSLYAGHEVASHTLTHPWLNTLPPPQLSREVGEDCAALKEIFGLKEIGFGVPFTACDGREINIIRKFVRYIRLSEFADSFDLPADEYHIPIHGLYNDPDIREKIARFAKNDLPISLFVMAGHSYELEMLNHWDYIEQLLQYIRSFDFEIMTTMDFVKAFYP